MRDHENPDTLKSRLVAKGYDQVHELDFFDTYAPKASFDHLRTFLAMVTMKDYECVHVDRTAARTWPSQHVSWPTPRLFQGPACTSMYLGM